MKLLKVSINKFYRTTKVACNFVDIENVNQRNSLPLSNFIRQFLLENSTGKVFQICHKIVILH